MFVEWSWSTHWLLQAPIWRSCLCQRSRLWGFPVATFSSRQSKCQALEATGPSPLATLTWPDYIAYRVVNISMLLMLVLQIICCLGDLGWGFPFTYPQCLKAIWEGKKIISRLWISIPERWKLIFQRQPYLTNFGWRWWSFFSSTSKCDPASMGGLRWTKIKTWWDSFYFCQSPQPSK